MRLICMYMYLFESTGRSTYDCYTVLIRCKVFVFITESERVSECLGVNMVTAAGNHVYC